VDNSKALNRKLSFKFTYLIILLFALCIKVHAQTNDISSALGPHIEVSLLSEYQTLSSGVNWLGVYLQPDKDWHTYWRNPGDSGEAPKITWTLPDGVVAGDIEWPIPDEIAVAHLINYGYEGTNLLMVPVFVESQQNPQGRITLKVIKSRILIT
jgi:DsbC/DsbD-like thiol-disulfide interchange protein